MSDYLMRELHAANLDRAFRRCLAEGQFAPETAKRARMTESSLCSVLFRVCVTSFTRATDPYQIRVTDKRHVIRTIISNGIFSCLL